jgi:hypothetical protein
MQMKVRITTGLSAVLLAAIAACVAHGVDDGSGGVVDGNDGGIASDSALETSTPASEDSGSDSASASPPPTADSGSGLAPGACDSLADCPYQSATGVSGVSCDTTSHVCVITCAGDNYDVNGILSDGCEVANPCPNGNGTQDCPVEHQTSTATNLGSFSCDDSASAQNDTGAVPSDDRTHTNPAVVAFDGTAGAAPTVFTLFASGGTFCEDDLNLNLQMGSPSTRLACYSLVAQVVGGTTYSCQTDATGLCQITNSSGSYSDGSTIDITVAKLDSCPATETDDGAFVITGHL